MVTKNFENYKDYLKSNFFGISINTLCFKKQNVEYLEFYRSKDKKECTQCQKICYNCNFAIQRYVIIDYDSIKGICKNYDSFVDFQNNCLTKFSYEIISDLKYNIYLLLLVSDYNDIPKDIVKLIESDMSYMRKIFIKRGDLFEYLENSFLNTTIELPEGEYEDVFKEWISILTEHDLMFEGLLDEEYIGYIEDKKNLKKLLQEKANYFDKKIQYIDRLNLKDYRQKIFNKDISIKMYPINIVFGVNGIGKTSILEAIEYALTGINKKNINNTEDVTEVVFNDEKRIESTDKYKHLLIADFWYNNKKKNIGEGINNIIDKQLSDQSINDKFNVFYYIDYDAVTNYIQKRNDKNFSEEYILSITNSSSFLKLNDKISHIRHSIEQIESNIQELQNGKANKRIFILKGRKNIADKLFKSWKSISRTLNFIENIDFIRLYTTYLVSESKVYADSNIKIQNEMVKYTNEISDVLKALPSLIQSGINEIEMNIKSIKTFFKKLYSYSECKDVFCEGSELIVETYDGDKLRLNDLNKSQLIALAISIILALRNNLINASKFVIFDEIAANFDAQRQLNFVDLMREMYYCGYQIFFTTADESLAGICRRKFSFLDEKLNFLVLSMDSDSKCKINKKKYYYNEHIMES